MGREQMENTEKPDEEVIEDAGQHTQNDDLSTGTEDVAGGCFSWLRPGKKEKKRKKKKYKATQGAKTKHLSVSRKMSQASTMSSDSKNNQKSSPDVLKTVHAEERAPDDPKIKDSDSAEPTNQLQKVDEPEAVPQRVESETKIANESPGPAATSQSSSSESPKPGNMEGVKAKHPNVSQKMSQAYTVSSDLKSNQKSSHDVLKSVDCDERVDNDTKIKASDSAEQTNQLQKEKEPARKMSQASTMSSDSKNNQKSSADVLKTVDVDERVDNHTKIKASDSGEPTNQLQMQKKEEPVFECGKAVPQGVESETKTVNESQGSAATSQSSSSESPKPGKMEEAAWMEDNAIAIGKGIKIHKKPLNSAHHIYRGSQTVFNEKKKTICRPVDVKIFHINEETSEFEQYIKMVKKLSSLHPHSNIVQLLECGKVENNRLGGFFIATTPCHKRILADIDLKSLSMEVRKKIYLQVCEGVRHLHFYGIANLDLKPSNIFFSPDESKVMLSIVGLGKKVGTQGWIAPEILRAHSKPDEIPNFLQADIFSLALVGHYILDCGRHPFANNDDPNRESFWEVNILENLSYPNFAHLQSEEDGYVASHLFGRMLSHFPKKRPVIDEVLSHFLFWDCNKRVQFFGDMHGRYLGDDSGLDIANYGTPEQKLLYHPIEMQFTHGETSRSSSESSSISTVPLLQQVERKLLDLPIKEQFAGSKTADSSTKSSVDSISFSGSVEEEKQEGKESKKKERKIMKEMCEVAGSWKQKVKAAQPRILGPREKDCNCSIQQLLRLIRNFYAHKKIQNSKASSEETWEFFSELFPRLLPYVYEVMEQSFSASDAKKYKHKRATASDIDLSFVLVESDSGPRSFSHQTDAS